VRFRFTKPSLRRVFWSNVAVLVVCCVVAGIALSIGFIRGATGPAPTGDYIRLVIVCITFLGPIYLLVVWWITIPAMIALGVLAACVRRSPAADKLANDIATHSE
jgi:hypothetical protein